MSALQVASAADPTSTSRTPPTRSAARLAPASIERFRSSRSGALSCTKSTPATASSGVSTKRSAPSTDRGTIGQLVEGPPGVVEHLADLARRLGIGVVEVDVDAVEHEPRRPPATDHTAAQQPDPVEARDRGPHAASRASARPAPRRATLDPHVHALEDLARRGRRARRWWPSCPRRGTGCPRDRRARCRRRARPWRRTGSASGRSRTPRRPHSGGSGVDHRHERVGIVGRAVGDAHAQLDHDRVVEQPVADQLLDHHEVAGVEHLQLGTHAELLHLARHRLAARRAC